MSLARSTLPATRALLIATCITVAVSGPARGDNTVDVRIDDAVGQPGGMVSLVARTYAPRPVGQGQLCLRARSTALSSPTPESPFASLTGVDVFSTQADVVSQALLQDPSTAVVRFSSPSATINTDEGPLAVFHLHLAQDLVGGQEFSVQVDLENTFLLDEKGRSISLEPFAGTLSIASPSTDDDATVLRFEEDSYEVVESTTQVLVLVERSDEDDGAVSVAYATYPLSAAEYEDFVAVSGTLSWVSGDDSPKVLTIQILDDTAAEGSETFGLALSNPQGGASLDPDRGHTVVTILDNDVTSGADDEDGSPGVVGFDQRTYLALEGAGLAIVSVERSEGEDGTISVDYTSRDVSATEGEDYSWVTGTLIWPSDDDDPRTFVVPILDDGLTEGSETLEVMLSNPTGGALLNSERATAVLNILDDDGDTRETAAGVIRFTEATYEVTEGMTSATIGVERRRGQQGAVSVDYFLGDGSATAGDDYSASSGTLNWGAGEAGGKVFSVPILEDDVPEGNEIVHLLLDNPIGGAVVESVGRTALLTIIDNDGSTASCVPGPTTHCLLGGRFRVEAVWRTGSGSTGAARALRLSDRTGLFWFFSESNIEMLVKVLDACLLPDFESFWVFFAATTNVDFTVTVTDTRSGLVKEYTNPLGQAALPVQDVVTFKTCP